MIEANASIGFWCPKCKIVAGMIAGGESPPRCSNCGRQMEAAPPGVSPNVSANVVCPHCHSSAGFAVGGEPGICPFCKKSIS